MVWAIAVLAGSVVGLLILLLVTGACLAQARQTLEAQAVLIGQLRQEQSQDARCRFEMCQRLKRCRSALEREIAALEAGLRVRGGGGSR